MHILELMHRGDHRPVLEYKNNRILFDTGANVTVLTQPPEGLYLNYVSTKYKSKLGSFTVPDAKLYDVLAVDIQLTDNLLLKRVPCISYKTDRLPADIILAGCLLSNMGIDLDTTARRLIVQTDRDVIYCKGLFTADNLLAYTTCFTQEDYDGRN